MLVQVIENLDLYFVGYREEGAILTTDRYNNLPWHWRTVEYDRNELFLFFYLPASLIQFSSNVGSILSGVYQSVQ